MGIAVDVAQARHDAAREEWAAAHRAVAIAERTQYRSSGTPTQAERQALDAAHAQRDLARGDMEDAAEVLERARVAYNDLSRRLSLQATAAAYHADQEAQEAQRAAAQEQARAGAERRGLRAIKANISRVVA